MTLHSIPIPPHSGTASSATTILSSLRLTGSPSLILDTVKRGEDDEDVSRPDVHLPRRKGRSIIVRIYDSLGGRSRGVLETRGLDVKRAWKVNILEDDGEEVRVGRDGEVEVECGAFEVGTWRLEL